MQSLKELFKQKKYKELQEQAQKQLQTQNMTYCGGWGWLHDSEIEFLLNTGHFEMRGDELVIICEDWEYKGGGKRSTKIWNQDQQKIMSKLKEMKDKRMKREYAQMQQISNIL